jgi:hypothetical protein
MAADRWIRCFWGRLGDIVTTRFEPKRNEPERLRLHGEGEVSPTDSSSTWVPATMEPEEHLRGVPARLAHRWRPGALWRIVDLAPHADLREEPGEANATTAQGTPTVNTVSIVQECAATTPTERAGESWPGLMVAPSLLGTAVCADR